MLKIMYTSKMKRDVKRIIKRGKDISKLTFVLSILAAGNPMPYEYKNHPLKGGMFGYRECRIEANWLLVYQIQDDELVLLAAGTGTHSDIFNE